MGGLAGRLLLGPASRQQTRCKLGEGLDHEMSELMRKGQRVGEEPALRLEDRIEAGKRELTEALRP